MSRRAAALALLCLLAAGCGGGPGSGDEPRLVVLAASSMSAALTDCSRDFEGADVKLSFAGSDELAAQIRQGLKPDVYAAANTALPEGLAREGLLRQPVEFATNELVLAVPARGSRIRSPADLEAPGIDIAIGSETVPIGSYTRQLLRRLGPRRSAAILRNVRTSEPDVKGVVGKLAQGAADAGFVYRSDVKGTSGRLAAIALPSRLRPTVTYAAGVATKAPEPGLARRYVEGLRRGPCADALRRSGFGSPPG